MDLVHGVDHLADHIAALDGDVGGVDREAAGLLGVVGVLPDDAGQLLHARRGLLQRRGLFLGALRQVGIADGDLAGAGGDGLGAEANLVDDAQQVAVHLGQRLQQLAGFVLAVDVDAGAQIAGGDGSRDADSAMQRTGDAAGQPDRERDADTQHQHAQSDQAVARGLVDRVDVARGGVDAGALDVEQLLDLAQIGVAGRHEFLLQHGVGLVGQPFLLELGDLVARGVVRFAHAQDGLERLLLGVGAQQRLDLVAQIGNRLDRVLGLVREERAERWIGALCHRGGPAHAGMHVAVPVADQPFLGQRLLHHVMRALRDLLQPQDAKSGHQRGQQQYHAKADAKACTYSQVFHFFYLMDIESRRTTPRPRTSRARAAYSLFALVLPPVR